MDVKLTLRRIIDGMTEEEAQDLLDFANLKADPDTLEPEEKAEVLEAQREMARGEYVSLDEVKKKLGL